MAQDSRCVASQAHDGRVSKIDDIDKPIGKIKSHGQSCEKGGADQPSNHVFVVERWNQGQDEQHHKGYQSGWSEAQQIQQLV
jgi:hypothetical protein